MVATAPAAAPCSRRFSSFRPTCFGARPRTPGQVPVQQIELKTERVAIAYRLLFAYAFIRSESERNSSHSLSRVGFAAIALAATRAARHITGRGAASRCRQARAETAASSGLPHGPARLGVPRR